MEQLILKHWLRNLDLLGGRCESDPPLRCAGLREVGLAVTVRGMGDIWEGRDPTTPGRWGMPRPSGKTDP